MRYLILIVCLLNTSMLFGQNFETYYKAAAENNPQLKAVFNQYYSIKERTAQVKLPDPSIALGVFILPVETRLGAQRFKLRARQMFPAFGSLKAQKSLINEQGFSKLQEARVLRNELYFNLRNIWHEATAIKAFVRIELQHLKLLDILEQLALQKIETGKGSLADVYQIKIQQNDQNANVELLRNKLPVLELAFAKIIQEDSLSFPVTMDTIALRTLTYSADSLTKWIQRQNPQVGLLEAKKRVINEKMTVQKTKNRPSYGLGLDYAFLTKRTDADPPQNGQGILMPMFSIKVPIYKAKNQARLKEVAFELIALEYQEVQLINDLEVQLEKALTNYRAAQINVKRYQEQVNFTQNTLDLILTQYRVDTKGFDEVLKLETMLLNYQKKLVEYALLQNQSLIRIEQLFAQPLFN